MGLPKVSCFKHALTKMQFDTGNLQWKIARFLMAYRNAPHSLTKVPPAKLFLGRIMRTNIDCIQPMNDAKIAERMENIRSKRGGRKVEMLKVGQMVAVRNYSKYGNKWCKGVVKVVEGPLTYVVSIDGANDVRRHYDQILLQPPLSYEQNTRNANHDDFMMNADIAPVPVQSPQVVSATPDRYPTRIRSVPQRYGNAYTHD